ncbi:peptide ABC transporter substrate-binding protein [Bacillus lacus]|uniref:Peptide ABC transporter substrate-binding protein n=1 Tax=Metabacillus lacus TaxID=1983721 RepID=A0A7X2M125_9BACI|nr:peptide ABC transporter substrate-binding protein [Metabacillus lacus]
MKKSKYSLLLVLTLVLSMFLSACYGGSGGGGQQGGGTEGGNNNGGNGEGTEETTENVPQEIVVSESSEIPAMDSIMAQDTISFTTMNNVNEGLYRLSPDQEPVPGVAAGPAEANEDGTVYTIKLKDNAKWSNGDPVTANDFVFAWQRAVNPDNASPYGPYMMEGKIAGATEIVQEGAALDTLGVKAIDDTTLEVTLVKPIPFFESLMAFPTFYPQNQKFVEEQGENYAKSAENLLYNGPFVLSNWAGNTASSWEYAKNDNYWDKDNVSLTKISFNVVKDPQAAVNAFDAGEVDITGKLSSDVVPLYADDERLKSWLEPVIFWIKLNQTNEALQNVNIRRAIATAFNKEDLVTTILNNGSQPANYAVPAEFVTNPETGADFREANGDLLEYNAEEAKKLWEKGLEEIGQSEVKLVYLGGDTETAKKTDEYIRNQLETNLPGLTVDVQSVPFSVRLDRDNKLDYDLQFAGWGPDYLDPISFSDLWITDGGNNKMAYSSEQYDKLLKDAQTTLATEPGKRFEALQEAERVLLEEDAGLAPVYQRTSNLLINQNIEGFTYHTVGPEYSYKYIKVTGGE